MSDADWIEKLEPSPMHKNADPRWIDPALPDLRAIIEVARDAGYAIGIHGSLRRDVDLMAMPWIDEAVEPEELIGLICHRLDGRMVGDRESKPLGRVSCNIQVDGYVKLIDISIAPKCRSVDTDKLAERIAEACFNADNISVSIIRELLAPILARNAAMEAVLMECRFYVAVHGLAPTLAGSTVNNDLISRIDQLTAGAGK